MAKFEIKNIVLISMIMLVVVEADGSPVLSSTKQDIVCLGECSLECLGLIATEPAYAACVIACGVLKCQKVSSKSVYGCATSCAISKTININTGISTWTIFFLIKHSYKSNPIIYDCIS
jgi:hypothetical protein